VVIAGIGVAFLVRTRVRTFERQIDNLERAKCYQRALDSYRTSYGRYPTRIADTYILLRSECNVKPGIDVWGNQFGYQSTGERFVLVSFGLDGRPDSRDLWHYRSMPTTPPRKICGSPNVDQVMSDLGFHQACYK
jgi:type II secretory pathway pseudopilin PulG